MFSCSVRDCRIGHTTWSLCPSVNRTVFVFQKMGKQKVLSGSGQNTLGFTGSKNILWKEASRTAYSQTLVHDIIILLKTRTRTDKGNLVFHWIYLQRSG